MNAGWDELGSVAPTELVEARLQAHWAAQTLSASANSVIPAQAGDTHTNLGWDRETRAFVTHPFPDGSLAALTLHDLTLHWSPESEPGSALELDGRTLKEALDWIPGAPFALRDYDMPDHPVGTGQRFGGGDPERLAELARWYGTADDVLTEVAASHENSSTARTWPHHFDIGLLISLEPEVDPEHAKSIGVGLSPGDGFLAQPYYYVNPYPRPAADAPPSLPSGGYWEQQAFLGAVLTGTALLDGGPSDGRRGRALDFLNGAIESCMGLLEP